MARPGNSDGCIGCAILFVALVAVLGFVSTILFDGAVAPEPKPSMPNLEKAEVFITGDDGGTYKASYTLWTPDGDTFRKGGARGTIESEPHVYPIPLKGFKSGGGEFFLFEEDIEVEVSKTGRWKGTVMAVLKVNGEVVECASAGDAPLSFDANNRQHYEGDFGCKLNLWSN